MRFPTAGHGAISRPNTRSRGALRCRLCDDSQADETIFLFDEVIRKRHRCSIRQIREESYERVCHRLAGVIFSITIFVAHGFDAYRTR